MSTTKRFVAMTCIACLSMACEVSTRAVEGEQPQAVSPREQAPPTGTAQTPAVPRRFDFEADASNRALDGFSSARSGKGKPGRWEVIDADDAPSGRRVVAQLSDDATSYRFPLLTFDSLSAADVDLSVTGKTISGGADQAIGLVWRYRDPDNYYVVRANALEGNVVLYKMENGKRFDLDVLGAGDTYGVEAKVRPRTWLRLRVVAAGDLFTVELDGKELFRVRDNTFVKPGKVGLWTKADSVTWFDDLEVKSLDRGAAP